MAKKKDLGISAEILKGLMQQSDDENKRVRLNKELREQEEPKVQPEQNSPKTNEEGGGEMKKEIKKFDRKKERPIQKTVHLTIEVDNKVNMIKSVLKTLGKKTTFEDFLFDLLDDWMKKHYDEVLSGKVVYPGE